MAESWLRRKSGWHSRDVRQYQGVVASTDNGITWTVKPVTGTKPNSNDPSLGIASDGTLYFAYADNDNHPKVKVSRDKGATWSGGTGPGIDLGLPFGIKQTAFPVAVAGDPNRAAVGFIGSPAAGDPNAAATFRGIWHAYVAMTYDGGVTWTTVDTTPNDPVQVGSICLAGTTCGADRNLLDFNDMTVDKFGRPLMAYADGCVAPACTTATAAGNPPYNSSRSSKGAIARQLETHVWPLTETGTVRPPIHATFPSEQTADAPPNPCGRP